MKINIFRTYAYNNLLKLQTGLLSIKAIDKTINISLYLKSDHLYTFAQTHFKTISIHTTHLKNTETNAFLRNRSLTSSIKSRVSTT